MACSSQVQARISGTVIACCADAGPASAAPHNRAPTAIATVARFLLVAPMSSIPPQRPDSLGHYGRPDRGRYPDGSRCAKQGGENPRPIPSGRPCYIFRDTCGNIVANPIDPARGPHVKSEPSQLGRGRETMLLMKDFAGDRRGVTMIEYALIAALVAMVCFSILVTMGSSLSGLYSRIESRISSVS